MLNSQSQIKFTIRIKRDPCPLKGHRVTVRRVLMPALVVLVVGLLVSWASKSQVEQSPPPALPAVQDLQSITAKVDEYFAARWQKAGLKPAIALELSHYVPRQSTR